jgi:aquaporin Z
MAVAAASPRAKTRDHKASKRDRDQPGQAAHNRTVEQARCLFAELLGTFALTLIAAGVDVVAAASQHPLSDVVRFGAPGLTVMAMIYSLGDVSGAHINPAVTLAFALRRAFPWRHVPGYWAAQIAGAVLAAALLRGLFGLVGHLGTSRPHQGTGNAVIVEAVLTVLLVLVILATADGSRLVGPNAGIAVGATIAFDGFFGGPITGASMNPARSLGPAFVSGRLDDAWIYVVGPIAGSLIAVALVWLLRGNPPAHAEEAATGEGKMS